MKEHRLKTRQPWFKDVCDGRKPFEFRKDDRGFEVGDHLILEEYDPRTKTYGGGVCCVEVIYILRCAPGLPVGYCIMAILPPVSLQRISDFKAGIKEVVEWIAQVGFNRESKGLFIIWDEWQAKLKEWGLNKEG